MKCNYKSWAVVLMSAAILLGAWAGGSFAQQNGDRLREAARLQQEGSYWLALELLNELKEVDLGDEQNREVTQRIAASESALSEMFKSASSARQRFEAEAQARQRREAALQAEVQDLASRAAAADNRGDFDAAARLYEQVAVKRATHAFETAESLWSRGHYDRATDIFQRIKASEVNIGADRLAGIDRRLAAVEIAKANLAVAEDVYMAGLQDAERRAELDAKLEQAYLEARSLFVSAEAAVTPDRKSELYSEFVAAATRVDQVGIPLSADKRFELDRMTTVASQRMNEIAARRELAESHLTKGLALVEEEQYDAARELIYQAIQSEALTPQRHSEALVVLQQVQTTIDERRTAAARDMESENEAIRREAAMQEQALMLMRRVKEETDLRAQQDTALANHYYEVAEQYYMNARFDDALRELDNALRHRADHAPSLRLRDEILVITGKRVIPDAVISQLSEMEQVRYGQARYQLTEYVQKGRAAETAGRHDEALDFYRRARSMLDFLRARFDVAPTANMIDAAIARVERAKQAETAELDRIRVYDASRQYQAEIRMTDEVDRRTIDAMMRKAFQLYAAQQFEDAVAEAQGVLAQDPGNLAAEGLIKDSREARRQMIWRDLEETQQEMRRKELLNMKHKLIFRSDLIVFPAKEVWEDIKRRGPVPLPSRMAEKTPRELQLEEALVTRISLDYDIPTEMDEIIEFMNLHIYSEIGVRNAIRLDPRVTRIDPRLVRISLEDAKVSRALTLLLTDATTDDEWAQNNELDLFIYREAGVVYISNKTRLLRLKMRQKEFRFYDVRDLLAVFTVGSAAEGSDDDNTSTYAPGYSSNDNRLASSRNLNNRVQSNSSSSVRRSGSGARNVVAMNELVTMLTQLTGEQSWSRVQVFTGTGSSTTSNPANNNPWAPLGSNRSGQSLSSWGQFPGEFPGVTGDAEDVSAHLGTMFMYGTGDLLVEQTPEIHERIEEVLTRLRAMVENQVHVEARFIIFTDDFLESLGVSSITGLAGRHNTKESYGFVFEGDIVGLPPLTGPLGSGFTGSINFLNSAETTVVMSAVKESTFAVTMQAPALTLMNTEASEIVLTRTRTYTSGFEVSEATGTLIPEISTVNTATNLWIRPVISGDRRYVTLEIEPQFTVIEQLIEQRFEQEIIRGTGENETTRVLTGIYYEPEVTQKTLYARIRVPDRGTAVLGGLSEAQDTWGEGGVPILANLPLIKRLFSAKREQHARSHQMFLVTPSIMLADEIEAAIPVY